MTLTIVLWIAGVVLILLGFVGIIAPALPGPAFVYAGIACIAGAHGFERIGVPFLVFAGIVTALILLVDFVASAIGTKKWGGSRWGILGAALGAVIGLFVFPPFGVILGPLAGAIIGELAGGKGAHDAAQAGIGSFIGFLAGTLFKYVACAALVLAAIVAHVF